MESANQNALQTCKYKQLRVQDSAERPQDSSKLLPAHLLLLMPYTTPQHEHSQGRQDGKCPDNRLELMAAIFAKI